jgi:hypothetical protein
MINKNPLLQTKEELTNFIDKPFDFYKATTQQAIDRQVPTHD